jgi:CxxC motif-containing protein (DUF1111 family)
MMERCQHYKYEKRCAGILGACLCAIVCLFTATVQAQTDPGPRGGAAAAGGAFVGLSANEIQLFNDSLDTFEEVDSVAGTIPGEGDAGLGPGFNGNSCAQCHGQPAIGGTGVSPSSPQRPLQNPQVALATLDGARNTVPSFITAAGPTREARFIRNSDGSLDGGVHNLYTIANRTDASGCNLAQPNFAAQLSANNVIFRIPLALFGLGLVEATPDSTLQANLTNTSGPRAAAGIAGRFNTSGNDGTITRFGWKAQNKSLLIFAAEAYNVEQGVTNEGFQNERNDVNGCLLNPTPEDHTNIVTDSGSTVGTAGEIDSDIVNFANFMRLSAPPTPVSPMTSSQVNGSNLFVNIGCALCHTTTLTTGRSQFTGMSNFTYHPYSDIALHHMGTGLADGVNQGVATSDEFRTALLWGVGQRIFFLHDGRTSNLLTAIEDHSSSGSEANTVINNFNALTTSQKQDLLNFLRSL